MKKIFNVLINVLPFFIWIGWFLLALNDIETNPDLGTIQILLLLGLPLLYSIYNVLLSKNKKEFLIHNVIFGLSQVIGCFVTVQLYYNHVSSDSETILVGNVFSGISILYISIATLLFYGVKTLVGKVKRK